MTHEFAVQTINKVSLLSYSPWWNEGIVHGMTLSDTDLSEPSLTEKVKGLCLAIACKDLFSPRQEHTDIALLASSPSELRAFRKNADSLFRCELGDAVSIATTVAKESNCAIGVRTADCVPILIRGKSAWSAIHAGWRGLANGVIRHTMEDISRHSEVIAAVVFPCAGRDTYEVGSEVIAALGEYCVARPSAHTHRDGNKWMLDLGGTARVQLEKWLPPSKIVVSDLCTITTQVAALKGTTGQRDTFAFHSYRRDGPTSGRSVTFVVP